MPGKSHGMTDTPEYAAWCSMKTRCYNPNFIGYKYYGGRGITVCERWIHSFENFFADMGLKPTLDHSLDRVDGDKSYCLDNCQWSTRKEQNDNQRRIKWYSLNGETHHLKDWARIHGLHYITLRGRVIYQGLSLERALSKGV
jgi:hypothetical protein